jgi:hypothetical protein
MIHTHTRTHIGYGPDIPDIRIGSELLLPLESGFFRPNSERYETSSYGEGGGRSLANVCGGGEWSCPPPPPSHLTNLINKFIFLRIACLLQINPDTPECALH